MSAKFNSDGKAELELRSPLRNELKVPSDEEVAACRPCRIAFVVIFSLILVAMLVSAIVVIATSKRCGTPMKRTEYWRKDTFYQVYVPSFKDTSGDGYGDLKGVIEKLSYFEEMGIKMVVLSGLINEGDFRSVRRAEDKNVFAELVAKARDRKIGIILAFDPTHSTMDSVSFMKSAMDKNNVFRSWYHWRLTTNNWSNKTGQSAWFSDSRTNESYYSYSDGSKPFLNYNNSDVMKQLTEGLSYWLDMGAKGFQLINFQRLIVSGSYENNPPKQNRYDKDLSETHKVLANLHAHVTKKGGFLIGTPEKIEDRVNVMSYFGKEEKRELDLVMDNYFTDVPKGGFVGEAINKTLVEYGNSVPNFAWPSWIFGGPEYTRLAFRYKKDELFWLYLVLQLTLPGCPIVYYGDELGLENRALEAMAWDSKSNGGFSTSPPWYASSPIQVLTNVEKQRKENGSLTIFRILNQLRVNEPALHGRNIKVLYASGQSIIFHRFEAGKTGFIIALNFGAVTDNINYTPNGPQTTVVIDTLFKLTGRELNSGIISLSGHQGLVLRVIG